MLIDNEDWSTVGDTDVWHAAKGGAAGAAEELRKREMKAQMTRVSPASAAKAVARAKARR